MSESFVQALHFLPYTPNIIVKLGENGILLAQFLKDLNKDISKSNKKNEIIIKGKDGKSGLRYLLKFNLTLNIIIIIYCFLL
jgi:hypothetical protein